VTEEDLQRRREYLSRAQREHMWQRRALITIGVLIAISVVILAVALVYENLIRPGQPVSTVNGQEITTADFQSRVRFLRWQTGQQIRQLYELTGDPNTVSQYASQLTNPISIGSQALDQMEEEILLKEEAEARGITIDEAAVDKRVDEFMAQSRGLTVPGAPTATPTTAPTVTPTPLVSPTPSAVPATATARRKQRPNRRPKKQPPPTRRQRPSQQRPPRCPPRRFRRRSTRPKKRTSRTRSKARAWIVTRCAPYSTSTRFRPPCSTRSAPKRRLRSFRCTPAIS